MTRIIPAEQVAREMLIHLSRDARIYLELADQLELLPPESDEAGEHLAKMRSYVQQVRMDTEDVIEAMDAYTNSLPDDD